MGEKPTHQGGEQIPQKKTTEKLVNIKLVDISPSPLNPREFFDEDKLKEMAASIAEAGVDVPVVVRPKGKKYELVVGERRWRAAKMAKAQKVKAIVRELTDVEVLEMQLRENLLREGLGPLEQAKGFEKLRDDFGRKEEDIGKMHGRSQSWVSDRIRLLGLPEELHDDITRGILGAGHAKAFLKLKDKKDQLAIAKELTNWNGEFHPSVRDTEEAVDGFLLEEEAKKEFAKVMKKAKVKKCPASNCGNKAVRIDEQYGGRVILTCRRYHERGHCWDPATGEVVYTDGEVLQMEQRKKQKQEATEKRKGTPKGKKKAPVHIPTRPAWFFSKASKQEWAKALMETSADDLNWMVFGPPERYGNVGYYSTPAPPSRIQGVLQATYSGKLFMDQRIYIVSVEDCPAAKGFKTRITIGEYRSASSQADNVAREKKNVETVESAIKKLLAFQGKHIGVKQTPKQTMIKAVGPVKLGAKVKVSKDHLVKSYRGAGAVVVGFNEDGEAVLNYSKVDKTLAVENLEVVK